VSQSVGVEESETFQSSWAPALPPEAAAPAMEVSHGVAARLSDHHRVQLAAVSGFLCEAVDPC
jgi:hypothetical protein